MKRLLLPIALMLSLLGSLLLFDASTRRDVVANAVAVMTPSEVCAGSCAEANCPGSGALCCRQVKSYLFGLIKETQETYEDDDRE
ncbi:MAG: hypothetical protein Q9M35_00835 [Rhodothermus sp.]|nr:hypothetical protein [Rhodothermus sp.]